MDIREKIIKLREEKGWTQYRLYKEAKIGQSTLSQIESGKRYPHTTTLQKIAAALDVSMAEFDFQNEVYSKEQLTKEERSFLEKYKQLSSNEKAVINNIMKLLFPKSRKN